MKRVSLLAAFLVTASAANASLVTFATWNGLAGSEFEYQNSGANAGAGSLFQTGTGTTATGTPIPISFLFENISGLLPPALQSSVNAEMTITAGATGPASSIFFGSEYYTIQPISGTITITADTPVTGLDNNPTDNLLLQISFSAYLSGNRGGGTFNLNADTVLGDTVSFSSDYLLFGPSVQNEIVAGFLNASPCFTRNTVGNCSSSINTNIGAYLTQLTANGSGSFAANPRPTTDTPEPAEAAITGFGMLLIGFGLRSRKRRTN